MTIRRDIRIELYDKVMDYAHRIWEAEQTRAPSGKPIHLCFNFALDEYVKSLTK